MSNLSPPPIASAVLCMKKSIAPPRAKKSGAASALSKPAKKSANKPAKRPPGNSAEKSANGSANEAARGTARSAPHRVVMLVYDNAQILDITGPLEVFSRTSRWLVGNGYCAGAPYEIEMVAKKAGKVRTSSGIEMVVRNAYADAGRIDTLLVTGGIGFEAAQHDTRMLAWIRRRARGAQRVGSICTGAFLLAAAGLLKDCGATTHWAYCDRLSEAEPSVAVNPDAIYVRSGNLYTSAGVTSGMDMALGLVEEDWGHHVAIAVARELVMYLKRPSGQAQVSRTLEAQSQKTARFEMLPTWLQNNLDCDLSVRELAAHCAMSPRNFSRRFREDFAVTPAQFVEQARIEAALRLFGKPRLPLKEIARCCGFGSEQNLRRAFARTRRELPSQHRDAVDAQELVPHRPAPRRAMKRAGKSTTQSAGPGHKQSTNQSTEQSTEQSTKQSTKQSASHRAAKPALRLPARRTRAQAAE